MMSPHGSTNKHSQVDPNDSFYDQNHDFADAISNNNGLSNMLNNQRSKQQLNKRPFSPPIKQMA